MSGKSMTATPSTKYVFMLIGIAAFIGSYFIYQNESAFKDKSFTAAGHAVRWIQHTSSSRTYFTEYSFRTEYNQLITFTTKSASSHPAHQAGEEVTIYYNPDNPEDAKAGNFFSLFEVSMLVLGIGGLFFIFGVVMFIDTRARPWAYR